MSLAPPSKNSDGFTLIEVIISIAILLVMSFMIYRSMTTTFRVREELAVEGDFHNRIRLTMSILRRDIELLYSPAPAPSPTPSGNPLAPPPPMTAQQVQDANYIAGSDLGQATQFWGVGSDKTGIRPSRFIGTETKISFISTSHIRIYKNSPESVFAKITYEAIKDEDDKKNPDHLILVKTESPNAFSVDDKNDKFSRSYKLLPGITKFVYRYFKKDQDGILQESREWDTEKVETKNIYPDIIQLTFEVVGDQYNSFQGFYKFRPEGPIRALVPSE